MDLFSAANRGPDESSPLAEAMRPSSFEKLLGQREAVGGSVDWRRLASEGRLPSLILWGPPGTGKTTFARLLASAANAEVETLNAIEIGAKVLRELGESARRRRIELGRRTIAFIDEIHRLNKAQQDVLLPFMEKGDLVLIGATTENPSYELNAALLSRARLVVFSRLEERSLREIATQAADRAGTSLESLLTADASSRLIEHADGDARSLLNRIESLIEFRRQSESTFPLDSAALADALGSRALRYDKSSDSHYDSISAFIKSVRGSDPDAAVYYLARMLKGGEDPVFIARRLVILASEDIGNADPNGLSVAASGLQAVELIGMPEAAITLAHVTTYLACVPKSNAAYKALRAAQAEVERSGSLPIPLALRSAKTKAMKSLGYGEGYAYSHEGEKGYVPQTFLPDQIKSEKFYVPNDRGFERRIREYLEWIKK